MKTVLHVTECLGSGVLYYVKNVTAWQSKYYNVVVAYSTRPETPDDFMKQFNEKVKFIFVEGFTREIVPQKDIRAFFNIKRIVKEVDPDYIHLHSTKAGVIGRWAINCNKYRVFYSPHAYSFLMIDCSKFKRNIYRIIEKMSDRKKCLTIADSEGELEVSNCVTKNAICIDNGINTKEIDKLLGTIRNSTNKKDKTVCMMGKIVPQKNPKLFNAIAEKLPEYNFVWIGDGPLKDCLKSRNITVTGWVSREKAFEIVKESEIFVFTSVWESLSIALLEVMYLSKTCIVSDCDGNRDVISNGVNGLLCRSVSDFVEAIKLADADKLLSEKLSMKAKEDVEKKYNTEVMEKKYKEIMDA